MNCFEYKLAMLEQYYIDSLFMIIQSLILLLIAIFYMSTISPYICVAIILLGLISMLVPMLLGNKLNQFFDDNTALNGEYLHFLKEMFQGFIVIKSFHKEKIFFEELKKRIVKFETNTQKLNIRNSEYNQLSGVIQYTIIIVCLCLGGFFVLNGTLSLAKMIAMTQISNLIVGPIQQIGSAIIDIIASRDVRRELSDIISDIKPISKNVYLQSEITNIDILADYVDRGEKILENTRLHFEPDKKYCIVGANGSGKSTLGYLLLNLFHSVNGEYFINGKECQPDDISQLISYVPQNSIIFKGTLAENITLFSRYSEAQVKNVLSFVNLERFECLNQEISENGGNLSGGECKKITIARAVLENKPIIFLDEFEASLDEESSSLLVDRMLDLDKSIIMVSHNLEENFLKKFDEIIFIVNGKVSEVGSYDKLMGSSSRFFEYVQSAKGGV